MQTKLLGHYIVQFILVTLKSDYCPGEAGIVISTSYEILFARFANLPERDIQLGKLI